MKVLVLTNIPSPYRVDFFNELANYCELTVVYERKNAKNRESNWIKTDNIKFNVEYLKGIEYGEDSTCSFSILKYLKDKTFDIILISGYSSITDMIAIKYLSRKKREFIFNCDGGLIKDDKKFLKKIKEYFISKPTYWLSTGKITDEYLKHYGADSKRILKYPFTSIKQNEIVKSKLTVEEVNNIKEELGIKEKIISLSVGQFIYRKGYDILINAAKFVDKNIGIYIIGGEPTNEYVKLKEKLNLDNIHFVNFKSKEELGKYYKIADLFVHPTREDIWGLVVNEAMAFGLPIITTNQCVAGLELIENEKNGYIVPVEDCQALSDKINLICNNETLRENMSRNNIEKIKKYTIENMALEHIEIFKNILQGR